MRTFQISSIMLFVVLSVSVFSQETQTDNSMKLFSIAYSKSVFRNVNLNDAKAASTLLVQEMIRQNQKKYKAAADIIENITTNTEMLDINNYNMITITAFEYLAIRSKIQLYPFSVPVLGDSCLDKILVLVRRDSNINSIKDLKGKKITFESGENEPMNIAKIWFDLLLTKNKIYNKNMSAPNEELNSTGSRAITGVFFKKIDAAIVLENEFNTIVELNPQIGRDLKILISSKPLLLAIICYTNKIKDDPDLEISISTVYNMHKSKTGINFMRIFKMKKLIPFKEEYLANISELFNEYNRIIRKK